MIKFAFCLFFSVLSICLVREGIWLIGAVYVFLIFFYLINNIFFINISLISMDVGFDILSYRLILLSFWIIILMYYSRESIFNTKSSILYFGLCLCGLLFFLLLSFVSSNLIRFYFFFWSFFDSYLIDYFRLGLSAWAPSSRYLFLTLYIICFFASIIEFNLFFLHKWQNWLLRYPDYKN